MVGHAIYPRLGPRRASFEPKTYELLRRLGFRGVAITDSLGVLGSPYAPFWARLAIRAGADLVLTTSARDASADRRRAGAARACRRARREARQGAAVPAVVTVTVASTVFVADRARGQVVRAGRLGVGVPAERVGRRDVGPAQDAVDEELDALRAAAHVDAPEHEAGDLLAVRHALADDRERCGLRSRLGSRLRLRPVDDHGDPPDRGAAVDGRRDDSEDVAARLRAARAPGEEERRASVDGPNPAVDGEDHPRRLGAPRPHAQPDRRRRLHPRPRAGARQRERLVVDDAPVRPRRRSGRGRRCRAPAACSSGSPASWC